MKLYYYEENTSTHDWFQSHLHRRLAWFVAKGITDPKRKQYRDFRNACATCFPKRRYTLLGGILFAIKWRNHLYKCVICEHYHLSRQSKKANRRLHADVS